MCNADVDLGDLLIHEGAAAEAQRYAAQVFGADRTYFVLNGTSTANKVVANAVLRRGDLVLFDRNNHKSLHQGALVQAGAIPVFLPTARNPFGMIGAVVGSGIDDNADCAALHRCFAHDVAGVAVGQCDFAANIFSLVILVLGAGANID